MSRSIATQLIHDGELLPRMQGAVTTPIFQSAMYEYGGPNGQDEVMYIRYGNTPNQKVLNRKLATLTGAEVALVTASGMAAISTALFSVLQTGDHLLAQTGLYGGTHNLITRYLPQIGVDVDFIDAHDPDSWDDLLRPTTKAVYVESITNPLMQVGRLEAVTAFARQYGLVSMIDNTFATPVNFRPMDWGYDLSLHSATKYLNGHSDLVAGVIAGRADLIERSAKLIRYFGGTLDPHTCFLLQRGLKTLALRMRFHNESTLRLARFLDAHPLVTQVNYPGLESHPDHAYAQTLFDGFSGMISFEVEGGAEAADRLLNALEVPIITPSLGSVETLLTRPAVTSHARVAPEERRRMGLSDGLIRLSVGIEATDDLIADFDQALATLQPALTA